jgi:hypothetical protein
MRSALPGQFSEKECERQYFQQHLKTMKRRGILLHSSTTYILYSVDQQIGDQTVRHGTVRAQAYHAGRSDEK